MSKVAWNNPDYHLSLSYNSSGYEQTLYKKNMQLTKLQFYINNIARCLGIVDILSERRQDHKFITFTSVILYWKLIIHKSPSLWYFPITSEFPTSQQHFKVIHYRKPFIRKETRLTAPKSILHQHTAMCLVIVNILYARRQY